jgi:hypothetical protein
MLIDRHATITIPMSPRPQYQMVQRSWVSDRERRRLIGPRALCTNWYYFCAFESQCAHLFITCDFFHVDNSHNLGRYTKPELFTAAKKAIGSCTKSQKAPHPQIHRASTVQSVTSSTQPTHPFRDPPTFNHLHPIPTLHLLHPHLATRIDFNQSSRAYKQDKRSKNIQIIIKYARPSVVQQMSRDGDMWRPMSTRARVGWPSGWCGGR